MNDVPDWAREEPAAPDWAKETTAPSGVTGTAADVAKSFGTGALKGATSDFLGAAGGLRELASGATSAIGGQLGYTPEQIQAFKANAAAVAEMTPAGAILANAPTPAQIQRGVESVTGPLHAPETTAGKYAQTTGEFMGNPMSYFGPGGWIEKALMAGVSGLGSEAGGQLTQGTPFEGAGRLAGAVLAGPAAARAVNPMMTQRAAQLAASGVEEMTPGQLFGRGFKTTEDKIDAAPLLGTFIRNARGRSIESFDRAVANQALAPIGERLERDTRAGHEAVAEVAEKLGDAYDRLIPNLHFVPDRQFAQDMSQIRQTAGMMPQANVDQFERILDNRLGPNRWVQQQIVPPPGSLVPRGAPGVGTIWGLQGPQFKSVESELNHLATRYRGSSDAGQQLLGEALGDVVQAMRANLERANPAHAAELRRINTGWAMYDRIRGAAGMMGAREGVFTPAQLLSSVRRADRSVKHGAFARGDALMQNYAEVANSVLPSRMPTSGTMERASIMALPAYLLSHPWLAAGAIAGTIPYSRPGIQAMNWLARPTTGFRGRYAETGRGFGTARPLAVGPWEQGQARGGPVRTYVRQRDMQPEKRPLGTSMSPFQRRIPNPFA